ncbi:MAG: extracellular solute-binding protein [Bradymonadia bacterium]
MKYARSLAAAVAATLLIPAFAAAETTVSVWHAYRGKEKAALTEVAEKFNSANADVKIKLLGIPYDAFADKISAAVPRGKGPDLFIFAQDRVGDWAASKLIEPLDFWMTEELEKAYLEPTLEALTYDDSVYGLPIAAKSVALFYNTDLVKAPPKTTDEMVTLAKSLTDKGKKQYGLVYENANFYFHGMWMQGFGGKVFSKKGKPTLASKAVVDSLAFAQNLAKKEGIMPQEVSGNLVSTLFNDGKAAMVINGPWFMGEISGNVKYKVAPLPTISASGKPATPFLSAEGVIMSAKAKDKKAAFKVMQYLTGSEAGKILATKGRQLVARKDVHADPAVKGDPLLAAFRKQLKHSRPMPNTPAMLMVWTPATTAMNKVINGDTAPADAAKAMQAEVEALVKGAKR